MTAPKKTAAATAKPKKDQPSLVALIDEAWHSTSDEAKKEALIAVAKRVEALEQQ